MRKRRPRRHFHQSSDMVRAKVKGVCRALAVQAMYVKFLIPLINIIRLRQGMVQVACNRLTNLYEKNVLTKGQSIPAMKVARDTLWISK